MRSLGLVFAVMASACTGQQAVSVYDDPDAVWVLQSIDDAGFTARATLRFSDPGRFSGDAPCNLYSGALSGRYPAFRPGPILSTKRACPDLAAEQRFFDMLAQMTRAERIGERLILVSGAGNEMAFSLQRDG